MFQKIKNIFYKYLSKRSVKKYALEFPYYLIREYGVQEYYSPNDIEFIITRYDFSQRYNYIAYAMFFDEIEYNRLFNGVINSKSYCLSRSIVKDILGINSDELSIHDLLINSKFAACIQPHVNKSGGWDYEVLDVPDRAGGAH